jgi:hypothetical protein
MLSAAAWAKPEPRSHRPLPHRVRQIRRSPHGQEHPLLGRRVRGAPSDQLIVSNDRRRDDQALQLRRGPLLAGPLDADLLLDASSIQVTRPLFSTNYLFFNSLGRALVRRPRAARPGSPDPLEPDPHPDRYYEAGRLPGELPPGLFRPSPRGEDRQGSRPQAPGRRRLPGGKGLPRSSSSSPRATDQTDLGNTIVEAFADAGLTARLVSVTPTSTTTASRPRLHRGLHDLIGDFADPLTFLQMWTSVVRPERSGLQGRRVRPPDR